MAPPAKRETLLRLSDRGVTVRVFRRKGFEPLQLEVEQRNTPEPSKRRLSLGHTDLVAAKQKAAEIFAELVGAAPTVRAKGAPLTLSEAVARYLKSAAFQNTKERTMRERKATLEFMLRFEDWSVKPAVEFSQEDALHYFQARIKGQYRRTALTETVGKRAAQAELQMLRTALNWGYSTKENGKRLIPERVFDGLAIPGAPVGAQPGINAPVFAALWAARERVHPAFASALALALAYGKRGESIRHIEWTHVDWIEHELFWSPSHDKVEETGLFWLPPDVEEVLKAWHAHPERPKSRWVFAAPKNADMPVCRRSFYRWLTQAYAVAGLVKPSQAGWHSFRRWFTTRNSGEDAKAAMKLAGMRNTSTFMRYQQPEESTLKRVLLNRPELTR